MHGSKSGKTTKRFFRSFVDEDPSPKRKTNDSEHLIVNANPSQKPNTNINIIQSQRA